MTYAMALVRAAACLTLTLLMGAGSAWAQAYTDGPRAAYVYPAGGRPGTTLRVAVGGQMLRGAQEAYVSGPGITATVVEYIRPLNQNELGYAAGYLNNLVRRRWSTQALTKTAPPRNDQVFLPDHPWLRDLDLKSPREIARLRQRLFDPKKQLNPQLADTVELEVTIAPGVAPGPRELRLLADRGLTNPVRFEVGTLPEAREEDLGTPGGGEPITLDLPVTLNGQIMPGEADRFRLRARRGQNLVFSAQARQLIPYLADAVPGWFQATLSLRDASGREVAYGDDYHFSPDPVLHYQVPADGLYQLEVRDAIYRGREDFVYRIAVGELPFVTHMFPLGAQAGTSAVATLNGWNLPADKLTLGTRPGGEPLRLAEVSQITGLAQALPYAVSDLPETLASEPGDTPEQAQAVTLPVVVNGCIGQPGDVDVFCWEGKGGQEVVAEVVARRLHSPLDSVVRLLDASGKVLASNDDTDDPAAALLAHQADSYLRFRLPQDGVYFLSLGDAQRQGSEAHGYRLRLSSPQPDFALRVIPAGLSLGPGRSVGLTALLLRQDGFDGPVDLLLRQGPPGFVLSKAQIPAGQNSVKLTLTAPRDAVPQSFPIELEGRAPLGEATLIRRAVPAEDMMQAFAYRHLVPQQELLVAVTGSRPTPAVWRPLAPGLQMVATAPLRLPVGGTAQVTVRTSAGLSLPPGIRFAVANSPRGVRLGGVSLQGSTATLTFRADSLIAQVGDASGIIVEVFSQTAAAGASRRSLGVLAALRYEIVQP